MSGGKKYIRERVVNLQKRVRDMEAFSKKRVRDMVVYGKKCVQEGEGYQKSCRPPPSPWGHFLEQPLQERLGWDPLQRYISDLNH